MSVVVVILIVLNRVFVRVTVGWCGRGCVVGAVVVLAAAVASVAGGSVGSFFGARDLRMLVLRSLDVRPREVAGVGLAW